MTRKEKTIIVKSINHAWEMDRWATEYAPESAAKWRAKRFAVVGMAEALGMRFDMVDGKYVEVV